MTNKQYEIVKRFVMSGKNGLADAYKKPSMEKIKYWNECWKVKEGFDGEMRVVKRSSKYFDVAILYKKSGIWRMAYIHDYKVWTWTIGTGKTLGKIQKTARREWWQKNGNKVKIAPKSLITEC